MWSPLSVETAGTAATLFGVPTTAQSPLGMGSFAPSRDSVGATGRSPIYPWHGATGDLPVAPYNP